MAASKARLGTNDRSSPSPYLQSSDNDDSDVESKKRSVLNGNGKRKKSPNRAGNGKKSKTASGTGTSLPILYSTILIFGHSYTYTPVSSTSLAAFSSGPTADDPPT